jgi:hypothetical protein
MEPAIEEARPKVGQAGIDELRRAHADARASVQSLSPEDISNIDESALPKQYAFREAEIRRSEEFSKSMLVGPRALRQ